MKNDRSTHRFFAQKSGRDGDRYIPRRLSDQETQIRQGLFSGHFERSRCSLYRDRLAYELLGMSYQAIHESRIGGVEIKPSVPLVLKERAPLQLENTKVLDAPDISDDFYHNVLCWGKGPHNSKVYIGLGDDLWSYDTITNQPLQIVSGSIAFSSITALAYHAGFIMRASSDHMFHAIDAGTNALVRSYQDSCSYTCAAPYDEQGFYLSSKDQRRLSIFDIRAPEPIPQLGDVDGLFLGVAFHSATHRLALSTETQVSLYDSRNLAEPLYQLTGHATTSKAISFSPGSGQYIATGGGLHDRTLKIWDVSTGENMAEASIGTQICNIHWLDRNRLFVTEGRDSEYVFSSSHTVSCWNFNNTSELTLNTSGNASGIDHTDRVLYSAQNPDDPKRLVTASPDETLRFWSAKEARSRRSEHDPVSAFSSCTIR